MVLLIDNYDSFSYNLYQLIGSLNPEIQVVRNDAVTVKQISELHPSALVLSPGPGRPEHAGICIEAVRELAGKLPILGVCLGHQAICCSFGASITYAKKLMHGKQSQTRLDLSCPLFCGCPEVTPAARYHSLLVDEETLPDCLQVIARADDGEVMGIRHREYPIFGLQFHPESIMTPEGPRILKNFLDLIEKGAE